jgi:arabinogalactan oligomer/maltooligosaccharide transport system substrate-binding protein
MKRTLAILLALVMVLALVACGKGNEGTEGPANTGTSTELAGTYDITVWVGEDAVDLTKKQIEDFNNTNTDGIKFNATVNPVSEANAADNMLVDISAGADLFCFAQDQFARLVQGGALNKLGNKAAETVKAANDPDSVAAVTSGDTMYAYPMTADNGYFMYYDKSVIPEEDIDSLEKLIADCEAAQKFFCFEVQTSAWYIASWFFATGCKSEWKTADDGSFESVTDTFNSPEGLIAAKGMKKLVDSPYHLSSHEADNFASDAAIVIDGIWDYKAVQKLLGDNMGVADLPSFEVDGKEYHLGSFNGYKLMGVRSQDDAVRAAALHKLAQFLTDETRQMERFEALSWGPSNINAMNNDAVKAHPGLAAVYAQKEYATMQGQIHGSWWDIAKVIGDDVKAATDEDGLKQALQNYYDKISALFTMTEEEKNAWGVIGAICGTNWDTDFPMKEVEAGVFVSETLELHADEEFKVRQGASWDLNYGENCEQNGANIKVPADGKYTVKLDLNNMTLELLDESGAAVEAEPEPEPEPGAEANDTWAVIGQIGDTNWDTDFPMFFNKENNHWYAVVNLKDGAEFKLRANGDWKLNYGLDENGGPTLDGQTNFKAESGDGAYVIDFMVNEDSVEIGYGKSSWGVIGSFEGSDWNTDVEMTEKEPGLYVSEPIAFKAGNEFKVRADGDWAVNFGLDMEMGGKNLSVEADGNYIVTLDFNNMTLTLAAAE